MKTCAVCGEEKKPQLFSRSSKAPDGRQYGCKDCHAKALRLYRDRRRHSGIQSYSTLSRQRLRVEVFERYGGAKCYCCGESYYEFLGLDHENGGGRRHRIFLRGTSIYSWIKRNGFPKGYRVLCHNCNLSIGAYGYCPHKGGSKFKATPSASSISRASVLEAAIEVHESGRYPSIPSVAKYMKKSQGVIVKQRSILIKEGLWPDLKAAIESSRKYRPDIHGKHEH